MKEVEIYQTVSSVGTFHDRELLGPIFCENNPWLGDGYYFWDSLLSNAEWWGKTHYHNEYYIFSSSYDAHTDYLFDLVGDAKHIDLLYHYARGLKKILGLKTIKVSTVIEFMKRDGKFPFMAIRAEGRNVKSQKNAILVFDEQGMYYLQPIPKIQLCVLDCNHFLISDYKFLKANN